MAFGIGNGNGNHWKPNKPESTPEQVSVLWDVVCNHVLSWIYFQNMRMKFVLALLGINVALMAVLIALCLTS